ncbi:MAG: type II toxin-antitoxin system HicA family toxin [Dehalococcoidia bacterium]|jgi:predicted RNA binding protein YcfA (HicA-like mRNA interferase family)
MKLPRDISGEKLTTLLAKYGYHETRRTGSHIRLTTTFKGSEHHLTVPSHDSLKIGTLNNVIMDLAAYLEMDKQTLIKQLFD